MKVLQWKLYTQQKKEVGQFFLETKEGLYKRDNPGAELSLRRKNGCLKVRRKRVLLIVGIRANKHMKAQNRSVIKEDVSEATVSDKDKAKTTS